MSNTSGRLSSRKIFSSWHIPEPSLIFGDGKTHIDPKLGLTLYGPLQTIEGRPSSPLSINVGVIGTGETVGLAKQFLNRLTSKIEGENKDPFQNPAFPGFKCAFGCEIFTPDTMTATIPPNKIQEVIKYTAFEDRVKNAVELFISKIESFRDVVPKPDVVLCALPQDVVHYCVVKKTKTGRLIQRRTGEERAFAERLKQFKNLNQTFLDNFEEEANRIIEQTISSSNFWRSLKAKAMKYDMPTQIVWPDTITPSNELRKKNRQEDSSIAWNIGVALYYKGSGFPWTMTRMKKGTCYVGISFFKDPISTNKMRTSMAQIFTYTGEGLILRGDEFEWDTKNDRSPHLDEKSAESLLRKAVELYERRMSEKPSRIVVHKSSKYWDDEKRGFENVLENEVNQYDLIAFGRRGLRFFRYGQYPPLRGTVIKTGKNSFLLYTRGYIPYLRTYPGAHIPLPLDIIETHGNSDPQTILSEILALSKMNWNSAEFSLAQPITMLFSRRVGDVMANINEQDLKHEYLYYM